MKFIFGLLVCATATCAFGGLVTNGTFNTDASGWSFFNADATTFRSTGGNPGGYAVLNNSPGPVPTMNQTIAGLLVSHTYQLDWDMISAYQCCSSASTPGVGAEIDGNLWQFIVPNTQNTWVHYTETFNFTGINSILQFSSQRNGTDTDAGLDNIVLTDLGGTGSVPEPSTWVLLGTGLASVLAGRRLKK
jgi:hypothetical protein